MLRRHILAKICAAAILGSGGGVLGQAIYKQIDARQKLEREVVAAELRSHETALIRSTLLKRDATIDPPRYSDVVQR